MEGGTSVSIPRIYAASYFVDPLVISSPFSASFESSFSTAVVAISALYIKVSGVALLLDCVYLRELGLWNSQKFLPEVQGAQPMLNLLTTIVTPRVLKLRRQCGN